MREVHIQNQTRPLSSPLKAGICDTYFCRLRGLMFRRSLPQDRGLLFEEASESKALTSIHMLFMFFSIGVVWINAGKEVVDAKLAKPWVSFLVPQHPAQYYLEIVPERLNEFQVGDKVAFET
jgi:uncharacterized membrane protein (UPF0127 family)